MWGDVINYVMSFFSNFPGILLEEKLSILLKFIKNFAWILINENTVKNEKKKSKRKDIMGIMCTFIQNLYIYTTIYFVDLVCKSCFFASAA